MHKILESATLVFLTGALLFWEQGNSKRSPRPTRSRTPQSSKIEGGQEDANDWDKFIVLITRPSVNPNDTYGNMSAGTIIGNHWILTARHVLLYKNETFIPPDKINTYLSYTNDRIVNVRDHKPLKAKATFCHPITEEGPERPLLYRAKDADVGLIQVEDEIPIGIPGQKQVKFPAVDLPPVMYWLKEGTLFWVTGWGIMSDLHPVEEEPVPVKLRKTLITANDISFCFDHAPTQAEEHLCYSRFYANNWMKSTLWGDNGGPAFIRLLNSNASMQIGITSIRYPLDNNIYMQVNKFVPWIESVMSYQPNEARCDSVFPNRAKVTKKKEKN